MSTFLNLDKTVFFTNSRNFAGEPYSFSAKEGQGITLESVIANGILNPVTVIPLTDELRKYVSKKHTFKYLNSDGKILTLDVEQDIDNAEFVLIDGNTRVLAALLLQSGYSDDFHAGQKIDIPYYVNTDESLNTPTAILAYQLTLGTSASKPYTPLTRMALLLEYMRDYTNRGVKVTQTQLAKLVGNHQATVSTDLKTAQVFLGSFRVIDDETVFSIKEDLFSENTDLNRSIDSRFKESPFYELYSKMVNNKLISYQSFQLIMQRFDYTNLTPKSGYQPFAANMVRTAYDTLMSMLVKSESIDLTDEELASGKGKADKNEVLNILHQVKRTIERITEQNELDKDGGSEEDSSIFKDSGDVSMVLEKAKSRTKDVTRPINDNQNRNNNAFYYLYDRLVPNDGSEEVLRNYLIANGKDELLRAYEALLSIIQSAANNGNGDGGNVLQMSKIIFDGFGYVHKAPTMADIPSETTLDDFGEQYEDMKDDTDGFDALVDSAFGDTSAASPFE